MVTLAPGIRGFKEALDEGGKAEKYSAQICTIRSGWSTRADMLFASSTHLSGPATALGLVTLILYGLGALWFDRCMSARPSAELLRQYIRTLELGAHSDRKDLVKEFHKDIDEAIKRRFGTFYSTKVVAGWREAHALERLLVSDLSKEEAEAQLSATSAALRAVDRPEANALADEIDVLFGKVAKDRTAVVSPFAHQPKVLLAEVLRVLHNETDSAYEDDSGIESKAIDLTLVGLLLIVVAGVTLHRETWLLFGAIGGFVSRLTRLLRARPTLSDYGAAWSSLMLAPVAGALAGWSGMALIATLAQLKVLDANTFGNVWTSPTMPFTLGLAFLLGFSERLLTRLVAQGEAAVASKPKAPGARSTRAKGSSPT
jgi:hypothetical protein